MTNNATNGSGESVEVDHTGHTVLILVGFFIVMLFLFGFGVGLAYLYYRHSSKKRKKYEDQQEIARMERRQQQIRYRALAAAQFFRGVPNWYSPNPKDENSLLLDNMDLTVVPAQLQTN